MGWPFHVSPRIIVFFKLGGFKEPVGSVGKGDCPAVAISSICSADGSLDDSEPDLGDELEEAKEEEKGEQCTCDKSIVVSFAGEGSADDSELEDDEDCDKDGLVTWFLRFAT